MDFIATDPPPGGTPASTPPVTIESGGERLLGVLHRPAGEGPHPIVVLLHGFPGNERNFDLAQALRRAGYAALVFHYRGAWGVGGSYSWGHMLEDAARVVTEVRSMDGLDPSRLAVVGHSVGGFIALMTAAADPAVRAVVSVAGFDLGVAAAAFSRAELVEIFRDELLPLRGTTAEALADEMRSAGEGWELARLAPKLADRPVLLIGTGRDPIAVVEVHHRPLVEAYAAGRLEHHVFPTDHPLSDHRVALARTIADFLDRALVP
ncbi:alpha/beta hydrolase family protein [Paractinoplanes globisporus]|uniref:Alpha/beta hydrolase family protein n=1 Tax=Paractinoplanes globisporus TaxID=113565 RepID=A0ABW6W6R5_9ACTN|nr:alpha/beta fold hydrolase [Actinoplanes globisporus]